MFDLFKHAAMSDGTTRMEAFLEAFDTEYGKDTETWRYKGTMVAKAIADKDPDGVLVALCGWCAESLARKAMIVPDEKGEFYQYPFDAEFIVEWDDEDETSCPCYVDPTTHRVFGSLSALFRDGGHEIKRAMVKVRPVEDPYVFDCVPAKEMHEANDSDLFWFEDKPILAVIVEQDYKGEYARYGLTMEEFLQEFPDFETPSTCAKTKTVRPMVHYWYKAVLVGSKEWETFFGDMSDGLPESDIENGNVAYVLTEKMEDLRWYLRPETLIAKRIYKTDKN